MSGANRASTLWCLSPKLSISSCSIFSRGENFMLSSSAMEERCLWLAVLWRAVFDLAGVDPFAKPRQIPLLQQSACAWIESPRDDIGSFHWTCNSVGLDPSYVRRSIAHEAERLAASKRRRSARWRAVDRRAKITVAITALIRPGRGTGDSTFPGAEPLQALR